MISAGKDPAATPSQNRQKTPQESPAPVVDQIAEPTDEAPPWEEKQPQAPAVTLEDIRQKVMHLRANGNAKQKDGAKDIIQAHAVNISTLPEDKWAEVWEQLIALERGEGGK